MEKTHLTCDCCGSTSFEFDPLENGYRCKHCGNFFHDNTDVKAKSVIEEATIKRNNLECKEALQILEAAEEKINTSSNLYFAKILARYGVIYVKGDGELLVPTMAYPNEESIFDTQDYQSCISNAKDQATKDNFNSKILVLEELRKKILAKNNEVLPSDVIICCDETSADCKKHADEYYKLLTSGKMLHKYSVFYKPVSLENIDEVASEVYVSKALKTARFMIVVAGPGAKGLKTSFNKNLITRFFALVSDDNRKFEKDHGVLTVLCDCLKSDLPSTVASDSHEIVQSNHKDFSTFLQQQLSLYVKKVSSSASIYSRVVDVVDVKPIVVQEIVVHRKAFAKANVTTVVESSEKSKLESGYALLSNNARDRHHRALIYAKEILVKNEQSGKAAFLAVLCLNRVDKIYNLHDKDFIGLTKNQVALTYISKSLEFATPTEYKERMNAYKSMLKNTILEGKIADAVLAYKLLIEYSDETVASGITKQCLNSLCSAIKNGNANNGALVDQMFEALYPVFTNEGDSKVLVSCYNQLGSTFHSVKNYPEAIRKFDESLKIYSVDPFALWYKMLSEKKCVDEYAYGAKLSKKPSAGDFALVNVLITMMKGGYTLSDDEDNYFAKSRTVAFEALAEGTKRAGIQLYKDLISLVPLEYADLRYNTMKIYPEFLCLKGMFKDANDFYDNIIKDYPTDVDAYVGKLKCLTKSRSILDLLILNKPFDDKHLRKVFDTITEVEARNNYSSSPIRKLNNLRDSIIEEIRCARRAGDKSVNLATFKKSITIANKICEKGLISPSIELVLSLFGNRKEILAAAQDEELLGRKFYATYFFEKEISTNDISVENGVKSITKNVKLTDSNRGFNFLRELLIVLIPAVVCWILFLGSLIDFDDFISAIFPNIFAIVAGVIGLIILIIATTASGHLLVGIIAGVFGGGLASGIIFGIAAGIVYGLSTAGTFVTGNDKYLILLAIAIGVLPYLIYKIIDLIRKRSYINVRYIVITVLMFALLITSPIIILLIN